MPIAASELEKFIAGSGLVSRKDLEEAASLAREKGFGIGDALISRGKLSSDDVRRIEAYALGVPFVDLAGAKIDFKTLSLIPEPLSRLHNAVAYKREGDTIEVALLDLGDFAAVRFVEQKAGAKLSPRLASADSIKAALVQYQKALKAEFGDIIKEEAANPTATRLVDMILRHAVSQYASDIHIQPLEKDLLVRYRIGGILHDAMVLPLSAAKAIAARIQELGNFKIELNGALISVRSTVIRLVSGEKATLHLSPADIAGSSLESVGFHGKGLEIVHEAARLGGLFIVAGPERSGISTVLYALADLLNAPSTDVSTIERAILRRIPRASQSVVDPKIGFSYAAGLRSIMRQDADVILVDDIADAETAHLALSAVGSGRIVLAGMHARSASEALGKLLSLGVDPLALASSARFVVAPRIARKLSAGSERRPLSKAELAALGKVVNLDRMLELLKEEHLIGRFDGWGKVLFGAVKAGAKGAVYDGVIGMNEVLPLTPAIRELVRKGAKKADIEAQAKKEGSMSLIEDGIFKAAQGLTTIEEVLRAISGK